MRWSGFDLCLENLKPWLNKKGIIVSARAHGIRVSPHFYNTEEEIEQLIKELKPRKA